MSEAESIDRRRRLPAVSKVLDQAPVKALAGLYGSDIVTSYVREQLAVLRDRLAAQPDGVTSDPLEDLVRAVAVRVEAELGHELSRMLNATGIFLHTNLGRAPLPRRVAARLPGWLDAYCDLEIDRTSGRRGERNRRAARLLIGLTGAGGALVTNNNAAALVLALSTLSRGREVVVSRGELVEIGGSFRVPEILEASGARLVEVGSTNRTRLDDYREAIGPNTGMLLKVNPSNYRITGFTETAPLSDLVELANESGVPLLFDEGSGLLRPHAAPQLHGHPSLSELLADGCHLVCGSGDKLLGGPQAGLLLGRAELIDACARNPLYRAMRPDRACYASLEAVLRQHLAGESLPIDRLWIDPKEHRGRLEAVQTTCGGEIVPAEAFLGGGAAPEAPIGGEALAYSGGQRLLERLREGDPPVVCYVRKDHVLVDLRTVDPADDADLTAALQTALRQERGE